MTFSFAITVIFWLYVIFWIQVPGMLLVDFLLPRRLKAYTRLLSGFFLGFICLATIYFIESIIGINGLIAVAGPVLSVIAFIRYFKKGRPSVYNAYEHFKWLGILIFGFIFIVSTINFQLKYAGALSGQTTQVYHDFLFHTGNIVSLSRSFPNGDIRISGLTFYYHYFYELIFAMCKHIFGMDAFRLYMNGNALICAWPLTLAMMIVGERLRGDRSIRGVRYYSYYAGMLVSCICLLPVNVVGAKLPTSWLNNHLFGNGNAMGLALSITVLLVDVLVEVWYDKFSVRVMIAIYLLAATATGLKGTTGIVLVTISWSVFIIESIIVKKIHMPRFFYVFCASLGFVLTYLIVTVGLNPSGSNNRAMEVTPAGTLDASRVGQVFSKLGLDYMAFPWVIIAVLLCIVCIVGPCILAFTAFAYSKFKTLVKENVIGDIFGWFAIGSVIIGVAAFCSVSVPGLSQGYFVITNAAFIFYGAMKYLIENKKTLISYVTYLFFGIGTAFLIIDIGYFCYDDCKQEAVYESEAGDRQDLVSAGTMEAYLWLRDNTPEDAMVAVDRFTEDLDYRSIYFYCSAFSERQVYIEGYDYSDITEKQVEAMFSINEKFYSEDTAVAEAAMEMSGVDYLVVTKLNHPDYQENSPKLKLVFTNDDVSIYRYYSDGGMSAVNN